MKPESAKKAGKAADSIDIEEEAKAEDEKDVEDAKEAVNK